MQAAQLLLVLIGLVALSSAVPVKVYDYYSVPHYSYKYGVEDKHTGDKKNAWESREGKVTKGAYSLVEPDGTIRVVEYHDDGHSGFNAIVKKIGHAVHPSHGHDGGHGGDGGYGGHGGDGGYGGYHGYDYHH